MGNEQQQGSDSESAASSAGQASGEIQNDSFMDTHGNPRLGTTEQREDQRPRDDKMIRRGETKDG